MLPIVIIFMVYKTMKVEERLEYEIIQLFINIYLEIAEAP